MGTGVTVASGVAARMPGVGAGVVGADAQPARATTSIRSSKAIRRMGRIVPSSGSCANRVFIRMRLTLPPDLVHCILDSDCSEM